MSTDLILIGSTFFFHLNVRVLLSELETGGAAQKFLVKLEL